MTRRRIHVPVGLIVAIVVSLLLGVIAGPIIEARATPEQLAQNVLLSATPFILVFVAIILAFVAIIVIAARQLDDNIPQRVYRPIELALIAGILLGIFGMFQPWVFGLFKAGFFLLLISTLGFILWSHVTPRAAVDGV